MSSNSCCGPDESCESNVGAVTRDDVRDYYGAAGATPQPGLCSPTAYTKSDIAHIPQDVLEISYGCGSPVTLAQVKPGDVYLDLGSGGGIDCFIASKLVGKTGRVIGVDMTPEMMQKGIVNAAKVAKNLGYHNVEFRHGFLEDVPADEKSIDIVTSNCVVNLAPDKTKVFQEIYRILKDGGRFVISDVVSEVPVPEDMKKDKNLWGECISGALTEAENMDLPKHLGFYGLEIISRHFYREVNGFTFWSVTTQGWKQTKGKECVYIGQTATYKGPFSQASDDEGHTFLRNIPFEICTDTAIKLQQAPYNNDFLVTDPTKKAAEAAACVPNGNGQSCC